MYLAFRHLVIYKWSTGYIMTCAKEGGKLWFSPSCSPHIQSHSFLSRLSLSLTHTHTTPHTTPPPMSLTCMLHSLDRHTVGNQNIITLSHTAANSGVATIQNSRAALTLNFHMKVGATKYRPAGRNWPAGREFETTALVPSNNMEEAWFMTYTAASGQVVTEMLWLHFPGTVITSIFINSL